MGKTKGLPYTLIRHTQKRRQLSERAEEPQIVLAESLDVGNRGLAASQLLDPKPQAPPDSVLPPPQSPRTWQYPPPQAIQGAYISPAPSSPKPPPHHTLSPRPIHRHTLTHNSKITLAGSGQSPSMTFRMARDMHPSPMNETVCVREGLMLSLLNSPRLRARMTISPQPACPATPSCPTSLDIAPSPPHEPGPTRQGTHPLTATIRNPTPRTGHQPSTNPPRHPRAPTHHPTSPPYTPPYMHTPSEDRAQPLRQERKLPTSRAEGLPLSLRFAGTGFKTGFDAKSSEKSVGKAAGGKGSSGVLVHVENLVRRQRRPTDFAADCSRKQF